MTTEFYAALAAQAAINFRHPHRLPAGTHQQVFALVEAGVLQVNFDICGWTHNIYGQPLGMVTLSFYAWREYEATAAK